MKNYKDVTLNEKSVKLRFISVLLAMMIVVMNIPQISFDVSATESIVLTNASVKFEDRRFQSLETVESGQAFYLRISISGNNVNQNVTSEKYRVYITDNNLLLPNFKGSGLVDGATYSGYTLHVKKDSNGNIIERYFEFDIQNGETKRIELQAKFDNGKTADDEECTVKVVQVSTNKSISNSISADASVNWTALKSQNVYELKSEEINGNGVNVNYNLSAKAQNRTKKTGNWWITGLEFKDTITLPDGMTFNDDAASILKESVEKAVLNSGFSTDGEISVSADGNSADISFKVLSKNTSAEMEDVNINLGVNFNSLLVNTENYTIEGIVENSLTVNAKPYGSDNYNHIIGGNSVSAPVKIPEPPKPAEFIINKAVVEPKEYYVKDDTVKFEISATNIGETAGDIVLTDVIPEGLEFVGITSETGEVNEKSVTFKNIEAGQVVKAIVECTVTVDESKVLTNIVNADNDSSASASINVKKNEAIITSNKSGYVQYNENNIGSKYITGFTGQTAYYTITITNSGIKDSELINVSDTIPSEITNIITVEDLPTGVTLEGNQLSGELIVKAGETVTIKIKGSISETAIGSIENTALVDETDTNTVTFSPETPQPNLSIGKSSSVYSFVKGETQEVTYTITVKNDGFADAENVAIEDILPSGVNFTTATMTSSIEGSTNNNDSLDISAGILSTNITVQAGETVTFAITGTIPADMTEDIINTASYTHGEDTVNSNTVTIKAETNPNQYVAKKWIVDENGNEDTDFRAIPGEEITFRASFENNSTETIKDLYIVDNFWMAISDKNIKPIIKIIEISGSTSYSSGDLLQSQAHETFQWHFWELILSDINLESKGKIIIEYTMPMKPDANIHLGINNEIYFNTEKFWDVTHVIASSVLPIEWDKTFSADKSVITESVDISDLKLNDLKNYEFDYQIKLNKNENIVDYSAKTFKFTDKLPDGMKLVEGSAAAKYDWDNKTIEVKTSLNENNEVVFEFVSPVSLINYGETVTISYKTKLTDEKALEVYNSTSKKFEFINTLSEVSVSEPDGTVIKTINPNDTATVSLIRKTLSPGFAKLAIKSFAGKEYIDGETDIYNVNEGIITAGDTLIWHTVVYNGNGKSDVQTAKDLVGYKVTDVLPKNYTFDDGTVTNYPFTVKKCTINADGTYNFASGQIISNVNFTVTDNKITFDCSSDEFKLAPNQCLVIEFATVSTKDVGGVITNSGYAELEQPFLAENVVSGTAENNKISDYANYHIYGITTNSYKEIKYTSQNHTVDVNGHKDPDTDTGISTNPLDNYVQGVQGEEVEYTLRVQNTSSIPLEKFVIIDRLPYVNDVGLVSGYERNSAFSVTMGQIKSVTVGNTTLESSQYKVSYSGNKTAVLNEYSKDWIGQNDLMSWSENSENAVNFRLMIDESVKVGTSEEVTVVFTGTVPNIVEKTGIENIAWNSFAYAYQNTEYMGDTVMVAEPAKVGVWVETPSAENKIIINKTVENSTGGKFYFALFDHEDNRISDIVSVKIADGETQNSVTMENIDYTIFNNANAIYLFETDENGNKITISDYDVSYQNNEINTNNTVNEVNVTNTKQSGSIEVTKTFISAQDTTDTFYFALFTKDNDNFVRYENIPVKSLTMTGSEAGTTGTVLFDNVPLNTEFYVLETNSNGILVDSTPQTAYTSELGNKYSVKLEEAVTIAENGKTEKTSIENTEEVNYKIIVSKTLVSDNQDLVPIFYAGLYTHDGTDYNLVEVKSLTVDSDTMFENLDSTETYYVFECNADGSERYTTEFTKGEVDFSVNYENGGETPLNFSDEQTEHITVIKNKDEQSDRNKVNVTKTVSIDDAERFEDTQFTFGIFTLETDGLYREIETKSVEFLKTDLTIQSERYVSSKTIIFENLETDKDYYIFELNKNGEILSNGSLNGGYIVNYPNGNMIYIDGNSEVNVNIVNTSDVKTSITFNKKDVLGNDFYGVEITVTDSDGAEVFKWTPTSEKPSYTFENLADGVYKITETAIGCVPVEAEFEVKNGYIRSVSNGLIFSADSVTIINKSLVTVSKKDISGGAEEVPGALITIKSSDTGLGNIQLSRDNTEFKKVDSIDMENPDYSQCTQTDDTLTFWSDGNITNIIGLPDGSYTLTEIVAPNGYLTTETVLDFDIKNAVLNSDYIGEEYSVENNLITVKDSKAFIVSKTDITGVAELPGAILTISNAEGQTIDLSTVTSVNNDTFKVVDNRIEFTSMNVPTQLKDLPHGTYILTEITAPEGYTIAESITFTVSDEIRAVVMNDKLTEVNISKVDIAGAELAGATLTIENITGQTNNLSSVIATQNGATADSFEADENKITFKSVAEYQTVINGLPSGSYILTETSAPEGYEIAEQIYFNIDKYGNVSIYDNYGTENETLINKEDKTIVMIDEAVVVTTTTEETTTETEEETTEVTTVTTEPTTTITTTEVTTVTTEPTTTTTTTEVTTVTTEPTTTTTTTEVTTVTTEPTTTTTTTKVTTVTTEPTTIPEVTTVPTETTTDITTIITTEETTTPEVTTVTTEPTTTTTTTEVTTVTTEPTTTTTTTEVTTVTTEPTTTTTTTEATTVTTEPTTTTTTTEVTTVTTEPTTTTTTTEATTVTTEPTTTTTTTETTTVTTEPTTTTTTTEATTVTTEPTTTTTTTEVTTVTTEPTTTTTTTEVTTVTTEPTTTTTTTEATTVTTEPTTTTTTTEATTVTTEPTTTTTTTEVTTVTTEPTTTTTTTKATTVTTEPTTTTTTTEATTVTTEPTTTTTTTETTTVTTEPTTTTTTTETTTVTTEPTTTTTTTEATTVTTEPTTTTTTIEATTVTTEPTTTTDDEGNDTQTSETLGTNVTVTDVTNSQTTTEKTTTTTRNEVTTKVTTTRNSGGGSTITDNLTSSPSTGDNFRIIVSTLALSMLVMVFASKNKK